jgi:hypothetical protein
MVLCTIKDGKTVGVDQKAYGDLRVKAEKALMEGTTKTPFRFLPVDHVAIAKGTADALLPVWNSGGRERAKKICDVLAANPSTLARRLGILFRQARKGTFDARVARRAKSIGFFTAKVTPSLKCPDAKSWKKGSYYYYGDPSCSSVQDAFSDSSTPYDLPVTMYPTRLTPDQASRKLRSIRSQRKLFDRHVVGDLASAGIRKKAPLVCKGPNGERAIYNYPLKGFWDLRYVIGGSLKKRSDYSLASWARLPNCTYTHSDGRSFKLEESKLLFNFGWRPFIGIESNTDGKVQAHALVMSGIAATPDSSMVRGRFMDQAPGRFFTGEMRKMLYLAKGG